MKVIGAYKLRQGGKRGLAVTVPQSFVIEHKAKPGELILWSVDKQGRLVGELANRRPA